MFASQTGSARAAAARHEGFAIYMGPCRQRPLVLQVQLDALGGAEQPDEFDGFMELDGEESVN